MTFGESLQHCGQSTEKCGSKWSETDRKLYWNGLFSFQALWHSAITNYLTVHLFSALCKGVIKAKVNCRQFLLLCIYTLLLKSIEKKEFKYKWCHCVRAQKPQSDLLEHNGLLLPDGVDGVALRCLGLERFPLSVDWQAEHVDLHVRAHFLIWQELAWDDLEGRKQSQTDSKKKKDKTQRARRRHELHRHKKTNTHLHRQRVGDDPVHCALSERVEVFVRPPHELWFESVATFPVVFIHAQVQLHGQICGGRTD